MAINTTLQTIKLDYEQNFDSKQIVVQCNLDTTSKGGVSKICQAQSEVVIDNVQANAKQIKVQGKAFIKVIFFNSEGKPQSFDYIADFVEDLACDKVAEEMDVQVFARVMDTESSASGNQIKVQSVIELMPRALETSTNDFVVAVEGALTKKTMQSTQQFVSKINESMQIVDSINTGMSIDEVLLFDCKALLCEAETTKGDLVASGRCSCDIIYLSGGEIFNQNICIPFIRELGDGSAFTKASISVVVKDSKLVIEGTEKENILRAEIMLEFCGNVFEVSEMQLISDVFCPTQQLEIARKAIMFERIEDLRQIEEKISGSVECDNKDCIVKRVVASTVVQSSVENVFIENGMMVCEGLVVAGIIFEDDEEKCNCMQIELPYSLQTKCDIEEVTGNFAGQCLVCDLSTKIKRGREVQLDATILITVSHSSPQTFDGITAIEEGMEIERKRCGISILIPQSGQTMWDIAKELAMPIEEIKAQNRDITEIMTGEERVVVYRELQNL